MVEKELSHLSRKPDFETESFRAWGIENSEKEKIIKESSEKHTIIVKQGDMELHLTGFIKAIDKKTDKVIFAYKFKHEDKMILYYISEELSKENQKKVEKWFTMVNQLSNPMNYKLKNIREFLKNIESNKKHLEKLENEKTKH